MMMLPKYESMEIYEASQQKRYLALLPQLGSHVRFEDDTWICDKRIRSATEPPHYSHIYYSAVPAGCKELVKYYVILRLLQGDTVRTVKSRISRLVPLLRFLENGSKEALLSECDVRTASRFKEHLEASSLAYSTIRDVWREAGSLLRTMTAWSAKIRLPKTPLLRQRNLTTNTFRRALPRNWMMFFGGRRSLCISGVSTGC
jgi:hypothetical protein